MSGSDLPPAPLCAWSPVQPGSAVCPGRCSAGVWQLWQRDRPELSRPPGATRAYGPDPREQPRTGPAGLELQLLKPPFFSRTGSFLFLFRFTAATMKRIQYCPLVVSFKRRQQSKKIVHISMTTDKVENWWTLINEKEEKRRINERLRK